MSKLTTETLHLFNKTKSIYLSCSFNSFNIVEIDLTGGKLEVGLKKINLKDNKNVHFLEKETHEALAELFDTGGFEVQSISYGLYIEKRKEVIQMFIGKQIPF